MSVTPRLKFPHAEHFAFFFEDTHLLLVRFLREDQRLLFLVTEASGEELQLDYPGNLYEDQVRDKVDRIFFVELSQEGEGSVKLALGAYFPVGDDMYGAYYDRDSDEQTLYFLRVMGEGELVSLEAVEDPQEHQMVSSAFTERYQGIIDVLE